MLQARNNPLKQRLWLEKGGKATLKSYSEGHLIKIPESHWDFLGKVCINSYETANHLFVHASLDPHLPLARQPEYKLFWEKFQYPAAHSSGKTMICGHTSQKSGKPINLGHAICIDTWAYGQGWLSCLDVETGKLWQVNQRGNFRISHIQDYYLPSSLRQDIKDGSPIFGGSLLSRAAAITFKGK
jgi:serine/threonine protein phosphatase 1